MTEKEWDVWKSGSKETVGQRRAKCWVRCLLAVGEGGILGKTTRFLLTSTSCTTHGLLRTASWRVESPEALPFG